MSKTETKKLIEFLDKINTPQAQPDEELVTDTVVKLIGCFQVKRNSQSYINDREYREMKNVIRTLLSQRKS